MAAKKQTASSHKSGAAHTRMDPRVKTKSWTPDTSRVPTYNKTTTRRIKHEIHGRTYSGIGSARKAQNIECGKGRGFECTRVRGHTGPHSATHPSIKTDTAQKHGGKSCDICKAATGRSIIPGPAHTNTAAHKRNRSRILRDFG